MWASPHAKILQTCKPKGQKLVLTFAFPPHHHRRTKMGPSHLRENGPPLDHDPTLPQYWSEHPRDKAFGANCNAFSSKFTGFCICHPIYHENTMYLATRHTMYSAALSTEATATFMFLPSWNKRMTTKPYASLYRRFPHICIFLGTIPSDQLLYAELPFWNNIQTPLPKHTWEVHIVATWNTEGRNCLKYACNKNWLKDLAKEISEVKWEISYIRNNPYPSAPST